MEIMHGKTAAHIDAQTFASYRAGYAAVHLDIGTGDGRFVQHSAQHAPATLVIGLDACRENLRATTRRAPANTLFVIANALALPPELHNSAHEISINFPWGSLITGLLDPDAPLFAHLCQIARPQARITVRLNGGALHEAGWTLENGAAQVQRGLVTNGFKMAAPLTLTQNDLRHYPTTWAKRLAFGRDPRALLLRGTR